MTKLNLDDILITYKLSIITLQYLAKFSYVGLGRGSIFNPKN